ncbi:hypothetical protein GOP47_0022513 [Adiantum capillus-veneris]|uniref:Uncharacterized protein n=1 Tax=Adiantum capillus-veneris TaxID=13818 RepID=A0A9D4Z5E6_ADICA|nr:hypothetical protein GOP47_0022513 [Adiantum capillus-veneris]
MEPACSKVQEEQEATSSDHEHDLKPIIFQQRNGGEEEEDADKEEQELDEDEDEEEEDTDDDGDVEDVAEEMSPIVAIDDAEPNLTTHFSTLVSHKQGLDEPEQSPPSYGDLHQAEGLNPNPDSSPDNQAYPEDYIDDRRSEMYIEFADSVDKILINSSVELDTIHEVAAEEDTCKEEDVQKSLAMCEKENLGRLPIRPPTPPRASANHDHFSRRSPRLLKSLPPLLPITQQQSMAPPPLKASKKDASLCRKLLVNECVKPVNDQGAKPTAKPVKGEVVKQRQPALPVNYRSAIKRRGNSNELNLQSPSSRMTEDMNEDEAPQNCSRASIESSPCLRQQGCISLDDVRRFSSLHITSRSSSRLERFSLRGGKIDRVARFAQLQKIWKKDSFVRGIDGEKRPQILHHLFAPTRAT